MKPEVKRAVQNYLDGMLRASEGILEAARASANDILRDAGAAADEMFEQMYSDSQRGRTNLLQMAERWERQLSVGLQDEMFIEAADDIVRNYGLNISEGTREYDELVSGVTKAFITMWKTDAERLSGNYDNAYDLAKRIRKPKAEEDKPLLSELIEPYVEAKYTAKHKNPNVKTANGYRAMVRLLVDIVGDMPANKLTVEHIDLYLRELQRLPANMNKSAPYRDLTVQEVLALPSVEPMAGKTVKNNLRQVKSFSKWLCARGYNAKDVAMDHTFAVEDERKDSEQKEAYTHQDIQSMAKGMVAERTKLTRAGKRIPNKPFLNWPSRYWVPILSLFSGFRLEEASQLLVTDIIQVGGIWCANCNWYDDAGNRVKHLKNVNAKRIQPLHQTILDLGFLGFMEQVKDAGHKRLFPELTPKPSDNNKVGAGVGAWYNGQKGSYRGFENLYVDTAPDKSLHSLRHTYATALGHTDITDRMLSDLMGHAKVTIAAKRYSKEQLVAAKLEEVNRIDYGVDFVGIIGRWDSWH